LLSKLIIYAAGNVDKKAQEELNSSVLDATPYRMFLAAWTSTA
jgi:hypothetical protein